MVWLFGGTAFDMKASLSAQAVPDIRLTLEQEEQGEDEQPESKVLVGHGVLSE